MKNQLLETEIVEVPPVGDDGNPRPFSLSQLANIYATVAPLMSPSELTDFLNLTPDEQEAYLSGFGVNVMEWQKAKQAANSPQEQDQDGQNGEKPDDGLDHWVPVKRSKNSNGQQSDDESNKVYGDIQDEIDEAEQERKEAEQNAAEKNDNFGDEPQDVANNASSIADAASQMAQSAQTAADAAQKAADRADENASNSGTAKNAQAADEAQASADAAQDLADQAKRAAQKAQRAADEAKAAADAGNLDEAVEKAKEAYDAAKQAANKAKAAQINAQSAMNKSKQTESGASGSEESGMSGSKESGMSGSEENGASGSGENGEDGSQEGADGSQKGANGKQNSKGGSSKSQGDETGEGGMDDDGTDPELDEIDDSFDNNGEIEHDRPISTDIPYDGGDLLGLDEEMRQKCREMAERAGQPLDNEDYISPQEYASKKLEQVREGLKKGGSAGKGGGAGRGFGNSPIEIVDIIDNIFASKIDWRTQVQSFLTDKRPENKVPAWAKRRMGLDASHPFYRGRYLHPNEKFEEKKSGLVQVFFLVDSSGSMDQRCGDGRHVFDHIMSELIQLELTVKIKKSAYTSFNDGYTNRDDIVIWNLQDAHDEQSLIEKLRKPVVGGGTSVLKAIKSIQSFDDLYSTQFPWTLLVAVTDGYDDYDGLKDICEDPEQAEHMIWIVTTTTESHFESTKKALKEQGVPDEHIVFVDIIREWGAEVQ